MKQSNKTGKSGALYIKLRLNIVAGAIVFIFFAFFALIFMGIELAQCNAKATEDTPTEVTETTAEAEAEAEEATDPTSYFPLTDEWRTLIEQVVAAEARGEPLEGQVAVCQCIYNACIKDGLTPPEVIEEYGYTTDRAEPTESVKEAVATVFDRARGVTPERILYFYAPALTESEWHETQSFVMEIGGHRFFKEAE